MSNKILTSEEVAEIEATISGAKVAPSGFYTDEPWFRVAPFGSEQQTIIKTFDPRVYPNNEEIRVAVVDPASEASLEIVEANARLIEQAFRIPALCATVRQLLEENGQLRGRILELETEIDTRAGYL